MKTAGVNKTMRVCSGAGCGRAIQESERFCDECKAERDLPVRSDDGIRSHSFTDRERYARLYASARWTRIARLQLQWHPMCERCREALAEIADHYIPAGVFIAMHGQSAFYRMSNLQSLCRACHDKKTDEDKQHVGPWVDDRPPRPPKKWSF